MRTFILSGLALLLSSVATAAPREEQVLRIAGSQGFKLASQWAVSQDADIKLEGDRFTSAKGQFMVTNADELAQVTWVPKGTYAPNVGVLEAERKVVVLRLSDGTYAKFKVVSKEVNPDGGATPYWFVHIRYDFIAATAPAGEKATTGERKAEAPPVLTSNKKFDTRLVGAWNLRIPTGVAYSPVRYDGTQTMSIIPGADFGRLTIKADGSYTWEGIARKGAKTVKGKLVEVKPYYALEGNRYYRVSDGKDAYVVAYLPTNKKPLTLIYFEGGAFASGEKYVPKKG